MRTVLKNAHVLVGENWVQQDVMIEDGKIKQMGLGLVEDGAEVIDLTGKHIAPGFIDVHLREPGLTHKETILTGSQSAARGGWTQIAAMPNTKPVPDSKENMQLVQDIIARDAVVKIHPYAAISVRQLGDELVDFETLTEMGAFAFTDDGVGVQAAGRMYEAMKACAKLGKVVVAHCEDNSLLYKGVVHQGKYAEKEGLPVTPHHLLLCEDDIVGQDTNYKMNPPLRAKEDQEALLEGLLDGTIDCIATDHAPHTEEEKSAGMLKCPFGIVGFETTFPMLYTKFVETKKFTLRQLIQWLTVKPAQTFRLEGGTIEVGTCADLVVLDLNKENTIDKTTFLSKGQNTPFHGEVCKGWPVMTLVNGKIVWKEDEA